ncbi:hypothetical protein ADUPG1_000072 [Aduncisulcus paluster]|uniref:Tetratricopeptide repeat protein n=1 Tax=Aduncisulcus paluster TaxID=2918883 RepID=A0ABQ5K8N5_9EUKA|nr:hypothetical protein ADUPG1_000072 [Aduncisulcus paluster]
MSSIIKDIQETIGITPSDAKGWLYAARGFYRIGQFQKAAEAVMYCISNPHTSREAYRILSHSYRQMGNVEGMMKALYKSVRLGNEEDWQCLIEGAIDHPDVKFVE